MSTNGCEKVFNMLTLVKKKLILICNIRKDKILVSTKICEILGTELGSLR